MLQPQSDAAIHPRMPTAASKSDLWPLAALIQNSMYPSQRRAEAALPSSATNLTPGNEDTMGDDDPEVRCDDAKDEDVPCHFCWPCHAVYCDDCWSRQMAHKKRAKSSDRSWHPQ